ncbi:AT-rich interactive domain-containing protein 5A [Protopterus annectens]|uniref:AT-rich interactive domain-containing protein 5A n=1 Tax=Protopterus annectens TaxID=7888 RepID=UPI001CF98B42|nr:AT-rich interactive domain-containing protein 5A [Protopterus annectens]
MGPTTKGKSRKKKLECSHSDPAMVPDFNPLDENSISVEQLSKDGEPPSSCESSPAYEDEASADKMTSDSTPDCDKKEEQTFLVNLYKFMKDRNTPIERIPHLGFKQINLWKIYKAVEMQGGYELVTGRRLWKNIYDELGGSPGSTSAATCTRRHYERLVLPYVRHIKGEEDKPLPPSKPRKQYKTSKENKGGKGDDSTEKYKRQKKEKRGKESEKVFQEKELHGEHCVGDLEVPVSGSYSAVSVASQKGSEHKLSPLHCDPVSHLGEASAKLSLSSGDSVGVPSETTRSSNEHMQCSSEYHTECHRDLLSSLYFKANHGIMSPLAKKKLLAQVSESISFSCHGMCTEKGSVEKNPRNEQQDPTVADTKSETSRPSVIQHSLVQKGPDTDDSCEHSPETSPCSVKNEPSQCLEETKSSSVIGHGPSVAEAVEKSAPSVYFGSIYSSPYSSSVFKNLDCHAGKDHLRYFTDCKGFLDRPGQESVNLLQSRKEIQGDAVKKGTEEECLRDEPTDLSVPRTRHGRLWHPDSNAFSFLHKSSSCVNKSPPVTGPKACWVPPMPNFTKLQPKESLQSLKSGELVGSSFQPRTNNHSISVAHPIKRNCDDEELPYMKKLKMVSPLVKDTPISDGLSAGIRKNIRTGTGSQKLAKPSASYPVMFSPVLPHSLEFYEGMRLRTLAHPADPLKSQPLTYIPPLTVNRLFFPGFNGQFFPSATQSPELYRPLASSTVSFENVLRQGAYSVSPWHSQTTFSPSFYQNTKL